MSFLLWLLVVIAPSCFTGKVKCLNFVFEVSLSHDHSTLAHFEKQWCPEFDVCTPYTVSQNSLTHWQIVTHWKIVFNFFWDASHIQTHFLSFHSKLKKEAGHFLCASDSIQSHFLLLKRRLAITLNTYHYNSIMWYHDNRWILFPVERTRVDWDSSKSLK